MSTRLSHRQAAQMMCVAPNTLYDWRSRGRREHGVPCGDHGPRWHTYPNGRFWYYEAADVEDYMASHSLTMTRTLPRDEVVAR